MIKADNLTFRYPGSQSMAAKNLTIDYKPDNFTSRLTIIPALSCGTINVNVSVYLYIL